MITTYELRIQYDDYAKDAYAFMYADDYKIMVLGSECPDLYDDDVVPLSAFCMT